MCQEPTEVVLIGRLTEVTSEIPIKYVDTKHQIADILTKGNFTRDSGTISLSV